MMSDPSARLSVLHVIVRAGATNSQFNEHCLPMVDERKITVCSLFPGDVTPPRSMTLFEGDGTTRGCFRVLRRALDFGSYDVVHVHAPASGVLTLAVYLRTRRSRDDLVFTVHNSWKNFRRRNRLFLRVIMALFPLVVVCGRAAYDSVPRRLRRRRGHKMEIVPNGVDLDRIDAVLSRVTPRDTHGGRTVVSLNRLIPLKDPATLLGAFVRARGPADRLVLVGDGQLRRWLERAVRRQGVGQSVTLTGIIPRNEVYRVLARTDVFVSTSGGEGLPVALLEAMACGCPVVVSDIAPHREIAEMVPGIPLVPVGDVPGFARALERMLAMSEPDRRALGRQLRECVVENFSVRAMNRAYGEVYMNTVNGHADRSRPTLYTAADGQSGADLPIMAKLRRRLGLTLTLTVLGGLGGFAFAEMQVPEYKGETTVLVGTAIGAAADEEALKTSAAVATTYADLTRRETVLGPVAAEVLGSAADWKQLRDEVHTQTGDKNPQLVQISAYATTGDDAKELATAVATQLIREASRGAASPEMQFLQDQLDGLETDIDRTDAALRDTQRSIEKAPAGADTDVLVSRADRLQSTLVELQRGYSELSQLEHSEIGRVRLVDSAWVSRTPLRPTPVALVVAGAGIGLSLAAAWVHMSGSGSRRGPGPAPVAARPMPPVRRREPEPSTENGVRPMRSEPWAEPEPLWENPPRTTKGKRP